MKVIRLSEFGDHNVLKLINNIEIPKPKENEVLLEVHCAGVNPVDTYRRSGKYSNLPKLPWTPGSDCSGTILDIGIKASELFIKGQRVYTSFTNSGAYASHALAPMDHVHHLPNNLSFQQGAALGVPYFTAYNALFQRGNAKSGETILIHGASGGVGIAAIQMCKARHITVIGTAGTEEGLEMIKEVGADYVFNHRTSEYFNELKEQFGNKINIILEMLADKNLVIDCELAALRGRIVVVGSRGAINFEPRLTMMKCLDIRGMSLFQSTPEQWKEADLDISKWLEDGTIKPVIGKEYNLVDAPKAHYDIINNIGTLGKLVLTIDHI